ncbi:hypothetical protein [Pantoea endophytica]|uniref:ParE family toxin-like protein n=1 Tax=Pantoea endophytica TaxID=92488 RepID=UPI003D6806CA
MNGWPAVNKHKVPERVNIRARCLLRQWRQGQIKPRRTIRHGYLSICVTPSWRLLSKNGGRKWLLLSHADYDKEL